MFKVGDKVTVLSGDRVLGVPAGTLAEVKEVFPDRIEIELYSGLVKRTFAITPDEIELLSMKLPPALDQDTAFHSDPDILPPPNITAGEALNRLNNVNNAVFNSPGKVTKRRGFVKLDNPISYDNDMAMWHKANPTNPAFGPVCTHTFATYTGLTDTFQYCTKCDSKKAGE